MRSGFIAILVAGALLAGMGGCAATGTKSGSADGRLRLDRLQGGMTKDEAVAILGTPTSYTKVSTPPSGELYDAFTYVNTVIDPGIVELFFQPRLVEIRIDTKPYRFFGE